MTITNPALKTHHCMAYGVRNGRKFGKGVFQIKALYDNTLHIFALLSNKILDNGVFFRRNGHWELLLSCTRRVKDLI